MSTQHSKVDLIFHSPVPLIEVFFFLFAGEWSGRVCQRQGSLFSLTLITSFTNLQIHYSTVCKGVNAITSSAVSRPVMTTGPMKLKLVNFEIWPVWEYRVKTRFRHIFSSSFFFCVKMNEPLKISLTSPQLLPQSMQELSESCRYTFIVFFVLFFK